MPNRLPLGGAPNGGRRATPQDFGGGAGSAALGQAVSQIGEVARAYAEAEQSARLTEEIAKSSAELSSVRLDLERDPDFSTHEERYRDRAKEILENGRSKFGALAARRFDAAMSQRSLAIGQSVRVQARAKQAGYAVATLDNSLIEFEKQYSVAESQAERDLIETDAEEAIQRAVDTGTILPANGVSRLQAFRKTNRGGEIRAAMRADPAQAAIELRNPDSPLVQGLTAEEREIWIQAADSRFYQEQSRIRAQASAEQEARRRAEKEAGEAALRDADDLLESGDLGALSSFVNETARDVLPPEKRRYYLERIAAGGGFSDTQTNRGALLSFSTRITAGEDVRDDLDNAFRVGLIDQQDRTRLLAAQDDRRFGDAERYLESSLEVGETAVGSARFLAQSKGAEAIQAFQDWKRRNPDATPTEALNEARSLVRDAAIVDLGTIEAAQLAPRYAVRSGNTIDVGPTLVETYRAYGLEPGQIDQAQGLPDGERASFFEQLRLIDRINSAQKAAESRAAAKQEKK